jgi:XTP/dITP diphosphohydrolase
VNDSLATPVTLVIATRNRHKVEEIRAVLGPGFQCLSLNEFPSAPPVEEDADTFAGNACKKAVQMAEWLSSQPPSLPRDRNCWVLADDSGLEVDALGGAPGVRSARFAAMDTGQIGNSSDAENNAKLLRLLEGVAAEKRTGRFRCVLALTPVPSADQRTASPVCEANEAELQTQLFEGTCEGRIQFTPGGSDGFGYDPLFVPEGHEQSFAQLGEEVKNRISHRARALENMRAWLVLEGASPEY